MAKSDASAGVSGRITLWGVEVFVAAAEEGSISLAARRLGASAATISQQLTNLETAIGATLLDRGARPATLTPAGEMFLRRANAILNEAEQARAELARADLRHLPRLRLGMIEDFDADVTPRLLQSMAGELQDCRFLLETGASHRLLDLLESRGLDITVASEVPTPADWMEVHPLLEEPYVLAVPRGAVPQGAEVMDTLAALPMVQNTTRHVMGRQIADHLRREHLALSHRFELDSYHAILAMVAEGAGWSILTPLGWLRAERFRAKVDLLPLPFAPLTRRIALTARAGVLGDMPGQIAASLRPLLAELIVDPATRQVPWLSGSLHLLHGGPLETAAPRA